MRLAQFYTAPHVGQALEAYRSHVPWSVSDRLDLYNAAKVAFESEASERDGQIAFDQLYESLRSSWQVFRNAAGPRWTAAQTFQVLTDDCRSCSRRSPLTAANLIVSEHSDQVLGCLSRLGTIKPTKDYPARYPWMAVSKFLHFFNPRLFPIFDRAFMWDNVANGRFKQDYRDFCTRRGFRPLEDTQRFNLQYTLWASEVMSGAGGDCMATFSEWFAAQVGHHPDPESVLKDVRGYHAAAFEMIAIGAAYMTED